MKSAHSGMIYQVQLTNDTLLTKLLDSKVNDYVTLGYFDNERVTGRLVYRSPDFIHVSLSKFYAMVDIKTKTAYFVDLGGSQYTSGRKHQSVDEAFGVNQNDLITALS